MKEQKSKQTSFTKNVENNKTSKVKSKVVITLLILILIIILLFLLLNKKTYTITFDSNGGSLVESVNVRENDTIPEPEDPTREDYLFAGWYHNDELYNFNTPVTSDMELEARWVIPGGVSGVKLNYEEANLTIGETLQLIATVEPEDAGNKELIWKTSNPDVVSIDSEGNITALKDGTAVITVTTKDGGFIAKVKVNVTVDNSEEKNEAEDDEADVKVTGVSLNKTTLTLTVGKSSKLTATVKPSNSSNKNVTWKSSNSSVVSVDSKGNIKALKEGVVTITVTTEDGKYTAKATITVKKQSVNEPEVNEPQDVKVTGISLNKTSLTLTEGDTSKLTSTINPSNATNKNVIWSSSNSDVVSVDSNGNIKALKPGTATITVTTQEENYKATCQVTVNEKPASYSVTFSAIQQPGLPVYQYNVIVKKDGSVFNGWQGVEFNNCRFKNGAGTITEEQYNGITSATITLSDGNTKVKATVYK